MKVNSLERFAHRKALKFRSQKMNLHQYGSEIEPKAFKPAHCSADLCFITDQSIDEALRELTIVVSNTKMARWKALVQTVKINGFSPRSGFELD